MKKFIFVLGAFVLASFLFFNAPQAQAYSLGFYEITANSSINVASQLSVDVINAGSGQVAFKFHNIGPISSSITDIFFDDGTLLGIASISQSATGVAYSNPSNQNDLPGANNATPPFQTTAGFSADPNPPTQPNGVNATLADTEWVQITFNLINGKTYDNTLAALDNGTLRIGMHIQGLSDGESESYVNTPVPIPAAAWLLGSGLVGLVAIRRRKK